MMRRIAWGFCLLLLAVWLPAAPARAQFSVLSPGPASFAPLVRLVAPAVVGIAVMEAGGAPSRARKEPGRLAPPVAQAAGSGFIVTQDGAIVTNNHVIEGAASIMVTLNDGRRFPAHVVGIDELTDLAVIRISPDRPLLPARWGDSADVEVGDWVLVAGNPFALGNSFTAGIVSAEGRDIGDGPFDHFLQLDAPINPGNSGGPAFNMAGQVVGVNTAIVSPSGGSVGIGFAIPSDTARKIIASLLAHGNIARGWLGVSVADLPDAGQGAEITGVEADGPAYRAGLAPADIVVSVDGETVSDSASLIRAIASLPPGHKVKLGITRNGHILTLQVVVDRRPSQLGE
jgi:serine protease Do